MKMMNLLGLSSFISASAMVNHHASVSTLESQDDMSSELRATMEAIADSWLRPDGATPSISQVMRSVGNKLSVEHAVEKIEEKKNLPQDVVALVKAAGRKDGAAQPFSEASLDKARVALNGLVEASWKELDDKIIESKEFEEQNRGTFEQVTSDISRLVEQISDLQRIESESIDGIASTEQQIDDVEATLAEEKKIYDQIYSVNNAEMVIRQNDLDVFTFILVFTKCADATSFVQKQGASVDHSRICTTHGGNHVLHFTDKATQKKYNKMLNPKARKMVSEILGAVQVESAHRSSLLQIVYHSFFFS